MSVSQSVPATRSWGSSAATFAALCSVFGALAAQYANRYHLATAVAISIYACFVVLIACVLLPSSAAGREVLKRVFYRDFVRILAVGLWSIPYLIYATGTGDFRWAALARLAICAAVPVLPYVLIPVRNPSKFSWQDLLVAAWLVCSVLFHWLRGVWNVPVNLDFFTRLFVIVIGSWSWTLFRPVPDLGYDIRFPQRVFRSAGVNFVLFAVIAIPLGLALRFTQWNPRWHGVLDFCGTFLEILLFIAWLEELFFRGFLQNLFSKTFQSPLRGQLLASLLFGLFHALHPPVPNWRYVILASIAGWFYGSAFRSGGTLVASALTHALVDTVWRTWFERG